jgi:hypothetical protein
MRNWTQDQKDLYRKKACFNCRKSGHFSRNCKETRIENINSLAPATKFSVPNPPTPEPVPVDLINAPDESDFRYCPSANSIVNAQIKSPLVEPAAAYLNKLCQGVIQPRLVPEHVRLALCEVVIHQVTPTSHDRKVHIWEQRMKTNLEKDGMLPFQTRFQQYQKASKAFQPIEAQMISPTIASAEPGSLVPLVASSHFRFHLPALLSGSTTTKVLADSGSQGMFMGFDMAKKLGLKPKPMSWTQEISYANPDLGEKVSQYVTCRVQIGSYWKDLNFMLSNMGESVILGIPWFTTIRFTQLDWAQFNVSFIDKMTERHHCLDSILQPQISKQINKTPDLKRITWKELERIRKSCISIERISIRQLFDIEIAAINQASKDDSKPPVRISCSV